MQAVEARSYAHGTRHPRSGRGPHTRPASLEKLRLLRLKLFLSQDAVVTQLRQLSDLVSSVDGRRRSRSAAASCDVVLHVTAQRLEVGLLFAREDDGVGTGEGVESEPGASLLRPLEPLAQVLERWPLAAARVEFAVRLDPGGQPPARTCAIA
jgi:hypothetical protein